MVIFITKYADSADLWFFTKHLWYNITNNLQKFTLQAMGNEDINLVCVFLCAQIAFVPA